MLFAKTLALAMAFAPAVLAAPTPSDLSKRHLEFSTIRKLQDGVCDLTRAIMPPGTSIDPNI